MKKFSGIIAALALAASGLLVSPASAAEPIAPPVSSRTEVVQEVTDRRSNSICGQRKHRVSAWEVTGAEGFEINSEFHFGASSYLLRVNTVYFLCNYARKRVQSKIIPNWNQYCVTLLEDAQAHHLRDVTFDGYMSSIGNSGSNLISTYVDTDNIDNRGDTNCSRAGLGYLPRKALSRNPTMQVTGHVDIGLGRDDKYIKVNRGDLFGIPMSPKISAKVG